MMMPGMLCNGAIRGIIFVILKKSVTSGGMYMSTIIICAILVVICFFGIRSSMKRVSNGCCGTGDDVKKVKAEDTDASHYPYHFEVEVEGMTCSQCKREWRMLLTKKKAFMRK